MAERKREQVYVDTGYAGRLEKQLASKDKQIAELKKDLAHASDITAQIIAHLMIAMVPIVDNRFRLSSQCFRHNFKMNWKEYWNSKDYFKK